MKYEMGAILINAQGHKLEILKCWGSMMPEINNNSLYICRHPEYGLMHVYTEKQLENEGYGTSIQKVVETMRKLGKYSEGVCWKCGGHAHERCPDVEGKIMFITCPTEDPCEKHKGVHWSKKEGPCSEKKKSKLYLISDETEQPKLVSSVTHQHG